MAFNKLTTKKALRYVQPKGTLNELYLPPVGNQSWLTIAEDPAVDLIITEGEKKAACATKFGFPTLGLGGVWCFKAKDQGHPDHLPQFDEFAWKGRMVFIVFDSDAINNQMVRSAQRALAVELIKLAAKPRIIALPSLAADGKTGLDDFLVSHGGEALDVLLRKARLTPSWVEEMNAAHFVVSDGGKTLVFSEKFDPELNRRVLTTSGTEDIRTLYMNEHVEVGVSEKGTALKSPKGDAWLKHPARRTYREGVFFMPAQQAPAGVYNLWSGFGCEPVAGDWSLLRNHVLHNICDSNADLFNYLIGWMATAVQHPNRAGQVAIVLRGGRGVGKGKFAHRFGRLFGQHYLHLTTDRSLTGNFNAHMRDAVVVFADEAFYAGDKKHESVLKALITEDYLLVEAKYKNSVQCRNYTHLIMASNSEWVVPAGIDERRYLVIDAANHQKQNHQYFAAIDAQMDAGGAEAMLYELMHHDLTGFEVRKVPATDALLDQKLQSLDCFDAWWFDILKDENPPGMNGAVNWSKPIEVDSDFLYTTYTEHAIRRRNIRPIVSQMFGKRLKKVVPGCKKERPRKGGERESVYLLPPLKKCRQAFEAYAGAKIAWNE